MNWSQILQAGEGSRNVRNKVVRTSPPESAGSRYPAKRSTASRLPPRRKADFQAIPLFQALSYHQAVVVMRQFVKELTALDSGLPFPHFASDQRQGWGSRPQTD